METRTARTQRWTRYREATVGTDGDVWLRHPGEVSPDPGGLSSHTRCSGRGRAATRTLKCARTGGRILCVRLRPPFLGATGPQGGPSPATVGTTRAPNEEK